MGVVLWPNGSASTEPPQVTSEFNPARKNPVTGFVQQHNGIDLVGWDTIKAGANGVVTFAGYNGSAGNEVRIRLDDGSDVTRDLHNSVLLVKTGQRVSQGQDIAIMGTTGQSNGKHNHHETRPGGGAPVNPRDYHRAHNTKAPIVPKEDAMTQSIKVNHPQFGSHLFAIGEEFLGHYGSLAQAEVTSRVLSAADEIHGLTIDQTTALLDGLGIPRNVLVIDAKGARVLNPETGTHEANGVWSRRREAVAKSNQILAKLNSSGK